MISNGLKKVRLISNRNHSVSFHIDAAMQFEFQKSLFPVSRILEYLWQHATILTLTTTHWFSFFFFFFPQRYFYWIFSQIYGEMRWKCWQEVCKIHNQLRSRKIILSMHSGEKKRTTQNKQRYLTHPAHPLLPSHTFT